MISVQEMKDCAARAAIDLVSPNTIIGLGSGSTATSFIRLLGEKIKNGFSCKAVSTSRGTTELATSLQIPLVPFNEIERIDLAVDGADEITSTLEAIKGGGGALLQEKMIAAAATKFVVIADSSKLVACLGKFPLPVEVIPSGWKHVQRKLLLHNNKPVELRSNGKEPFVTDNGNYVLDWQCETIEFPLHMKNFLKEIPGVVEHGLFIGLVDTAIIADQDSKVKWIEK